jgi:DNA modification methylase
MKTPRKSKFKKSVKSARQWAAPVERHLEVAYWPLERLAPYGRNARTHKPAQIEEIADSISAFGFTNPILVGDDGEIIAGHGRLAAAKLLNLSPVPVVVLTGLSDEQRRQLVLADNRIALNAGWDLEVLQLELRDLAALGADLKILGFTEGELAKALTGNPSEGLTDEDDVPEPADVAVSRPGDLWMLGDHRLICGDSTDPATVARLLNDALPLLMVTDPPYGVEYDPTWRHDMGINHSNRRGAVRNDERADWKEAWALFPGSIAYVWHGALHAATVAESLTAEGFKIRAQIVWAKSRLVIGRGDYHWQHEPCWYGVKNTGHWLGDRKQTTLWTIESGGQDAETIHGTQKPVECMRRPIINHTAPGDLVYEPFSGSGTTLIAAESIKRICLGVELDPAYVDVAIRRWESFTGRSAVLAGSGEKFAAVSQTRLAPDIEVCSTHQSEDHTDQDPAGEPILAGSPILERDTNARP